MSKWIFLSVLIGLVSFLGWLAFQVIQFNRLLAGMF